jgi:hypothetical protein
LKQINRRSIVDTVALSDSAPFARRLFAYEGLCAKIEATPRADENTIDQLADESHRLLIDLVKTPTLGVSDLAAKMKAIQRRHGNRDFDKAAAGDSCVTFEEGVLVQMMNDATAMSDHIEKCLSNANVIPEAANNAIGELEVKLAAARGLDTQEREYHRRRIANAGCMIAVAMNLLREVEA